MTLINADQNRYEADEFVGFIRVHQRHQRFLLFALAAASPHCERPCKLLRSD